MQIIYSKHWQLKRALRPDISDDVIEYAISNSKIWKDKYWEDALNAICRVPPSGRLLKVVYKKSQNKVKLITAYWLD